MSKCSRETKNGKEGKSEKLENRKDALAAVNGDEIYVGLDVHKKKYHVAIWKNGKESSCGVMPANNQLVVEMLEGARGGLKKVVYEAGPTGFGLARALQRANFPIGVVAPGKTRKAANERNKSDRLDGRMLAADAAKEQLVYVAIPTAKEEDDRQVVRTRDALKKKRKRVMLQIKSFLLQHGIAEPGGLDRWKQSTVNELTKLDMSPGLRFSLDELVAEFAYLNEALRRAGKAFKRIAEEQQEKIDILLSHPGVGMLTSMHFLTEIFQPQRFAQASSVAEYLGLNPKIRQSGEKRRDIGTISCGREELRSLLVEASWIWVRHDQKARATYVRLVGNTGSAKKAIYAMARKLTLHLWAMLVRMEPFRIAA